MPGHKTGPPGRRPGSLGPEGSSLPSTGQHGPPGKDRSDIRHDHDEDNDNDDVMILLQTEGSKGPGRGRPGP